jgi:hypothetical protein
MRKRKDFRDDLQGKETIFKSVKNTYQSSQSSFKNSLEDFLTKSILLFNRLFSL